MEPDGESEPGTVRIAAPSIPPTRSSAGTADTRWQSRGRPRDRAAPPGILSSGGSAWASSASSSSACWPASEPAAAGEDAPLASAAAGEEFFQALATGGVLDLDRKSAV